MKIYERFLVRLDGKPGNAISRMALGLAIPPLVRTLFDGNDNVWGALALFLALLMLLRLIPTALRHTLPFSAEAKRLWADRRAIAKQNDSYQWRKLFWIGLGMLPYVFIGDGLRHGEVAIISFCLIGGGAGLLFWSKRKVACAAS